MQYGFSQCVLIGKFRRIRKDTRTIFFRFLRCWNALFFETYIIVWKKSYNRAS